MPSQKAKPATRRGSATKAGASASKGGRPSKFKDEQIEQVRKLAALGATDLEIADFLTIDVATLYRWKADKPGFCDALRVGKEIADERVVRSLYWRANGYEHDEVDIRVVDKTVVQTPIRKFYPPDTTAAIFWLKNRRPQEWRDRVEQTLSGPDGGPVQVTDPARPRLSREEWLAAHGVKLP